jgi:riboflavin synthase
MFTGIITHLGKIKSKTETSFIIEADTSLTEILEKGTSIAVNGTCLTVLEKPIANIFSVEVMPETWKRTALETLLNEAIVNLELSVTPATLLSGHIVQGHVDGIGHLTEIKEEGNSKLLTITIPHALTKYIVEKGSITINGISLTVITVTESSFSVGIIPFTWEHTMMHTLEQGNAVNIEVDVLAKYLEKLVKK